jgi:hypothetical protein
MKKAFAYTVGYLAAFSVMTILVGAAAFIAFYFIAIGLVSFIVWSLPIIWPSVWFVLRLSIVCGFIVGLLFVVSKEGREYANKIAKDII